jgi:acyl-coenzyme A synthetase/AMP-(fatty) acid ligase
LVTAVVVLHQDYQPSPELAKELIEYTKGKLAGYKRPKKVKFINDEDMPRTATGKILHRILREEFGKWSDAN